MTLIDVIACSISDDTVEPMATGLAAILCSLTGITAKDIHGVMPVVAPICGLIVAHQCGGLARPYTTNPSTERELVRIIEDGKSAFKAGKAFGERLLQSGSRLSASVTTSAPLPRGK